MAVVGWARARRRTGFAADLAERYQAFLPYVLPRISRLDPALVPAGYEAGLVAAHTETLRDALNVASDEGRLKEEWLHLPPEERATLSRRLFRRCVERATRQGYPTDRWEQLSVSADVQNAPLGGTDRPA